MPKFTGFPAESLEFLHELSLNNDRDWWAEHKDRYEAVLDSAVSRARPVVLAAATTILGLIPLLSDVFFVNMSVTIMAGLGFASVLTLIIVPTLYAVFFRIEKKPG